MKGRSPSCPTVQDDYHAGVKQQTGRAGLAKEPVAQKGRFGVVRQGGQSDDFDGNVAPNQRIEGPVDDAHGSPAQFA